MLDEDQLALYYRSCLQGLEADLRWYTTRAYVDDVDDVRRALGYERINIGGESYGATVVQVYLLQHPEALRMAAILRCTLLNYPILEHFPDSSQRALDLIFERCIKNSHGVKNEESTRHTGVYVCRDPRQPWSTMWPQMQWFQ